MQYDYWHRQVPGKPLFPDIEWQKPEQKALAGKLLIIGGNAHSFAAVATAYQDAQKARIGQCRVVLPDALKKTVDPSTLDCLFVPTNASGGITKDALSTLKAGAAWADGLLLIGDAGRNSETAVVYEQLLQALPQKPTIITRDAIDLLKNNWPELLERSNTAFIASFAQLQKIFQSVYYPKPLLFSMQLAHLVEALHKFTITYGAMMITFHQGHMVVAYQEQVSSTNWDDPMLIWRGSAAAKASVYAVQHPAKLFEAITVSFAQDE